MKKAAFFWILFLLPFGISAQLKSFELTNPLALELTDSTLQLLSSQSWRVIQIDTDVRGILTETEGRRILKYNADGSFTYRYPGTWEVVNGRYLKHMFKDDKGKEVNFGGIYAVAEISSSKLTLSKILTSSHDMKRTMYFEPARDQQQATVASSFRLKPFQHHQNCILVRLIPHHWIRLVNYPWSICLRTITLLIRT